MNSRHPFRIFSLVVAALTATLGARADDSSPFLIPFQGRLTDIAGKVYTNGQYTITFNLYNYAVAGSTLWSETHQNVGVINGMVNVFLGSINPLTNITFSTTRYLGITIDADKNPNSGDPEMVPRQMIIPAFWAKHADNSTKLAGYDWTDILADGSQNPAIGYIAGTKLKQGSVNGDRLSQGSVNGDRITAGTIDGDRITLRSISRNRLQTNTITAAEISPSASIPFSALAGRASGDSVRNGNFASAPVTSKIVSAGDGNNPEQLASITIDCSGVRPILVMVVPDASAQAADAFQAAHFYALSTGGSGYATIFLCEGANQLYKSKVFYGAAFDIDRGPENWSAGSGASFLFLVPPGPSGSRTFALKACVSYGVTGLNVMGYRLVALEL